MVIAESPFSVKSEVTLITPDNRHGAPDTLRMGVAAAYDLHIGGSFGWTTLSLSVGYSQRFLDEGQAVVSSPRLSIGSVYDRGARWTPFASYQVAAGTSIDAYVGMDIDLKSGAIDSVLGLGLTLSEFSLSADD